MIGQQGKRYQAAIYCRLSKDDGNLAESSSISTQREMLTRYVREQGWQLVGEYIDDGYSGINFNRPDFKRMISDIEAGKINCVITKDLSRLGRNYLEAGAYIEIFFPEHGIRYIALHDGVDTNETSNSSMDITPFKNLVNEMYARDIGRKVKTAKRTRLMQGKFMGTYTPYGYKKDPADKNHLIVDEETAPIVKRIFDYSRQGLGIAKIGKIMTSERILRPGMYVFKNTGNYERFLTDEHKRYTWNYTAVRGILRNPVYAGHLVGQKRPYVSIKSSKRAAAAQEDWIVVKNTHDAIIPQDEWELVQRLITSRRKGIPGSHGYDNIFSGLIKCADCGSALCIHPVSGRNFPNPIDNMCYYCTLYRRQGKSACSQHLIRARALHDTVLTDIQKHAAMALQDDRDLLKRITRKLDTNNESESSGLKKELRQTEKRLSELDRLFAKLYEDRLEGKISEWNYNSLSMRYEDEQKSLHERITYIKQHLEANQIASNNAEIWIKKIKDYAEATELSAPLLNELIDRITVSEAEKMGKVRHQTVNIYYRFIGCIE